MDHHGLLTLTREVNTTLRGIQHVRSTGSPEWAWQGTPVYYPETHCPFCNQVVRSNGIWFLDGPKHERLLGAIFIEQDKKVVLIQPSHPHDTGGGMLCLGRNVSGIALLASTPNVRDSPMGSYYISRWLKKYWNRHDCQQGKDYIKAQKPYNWEAILRELNRL